MGPEFAFNLDCVRTLRSFNPQEFCGLDARVHWCEWRHEYEGSRGLAAQIADTVRANWPRFIRPGSIVIDIGAHSGDTAIPLGIFARDKLGNKPGTVLAIEPNPDVFNVLDINLSLNSHLANFVPIKAAVTPKDCDEVELSDLGTAMCNTGIISAKFDEPRQLGLKIASKNTFMAKGLSLATIIRQYVPVEKVSDISFIKIDCEGFDKEIIEAANDVLSVIRPTLYVEWFNGFSAGESQELFRSIMSVNYIPLHPETLARASVGTWISDLICLPAEHVTGLGL